MPVILERCISLDVGSFRVDWSTPGKIWTGNSRWFQGDEETGSVGYRIHADPVRPLLVLLYSIDGQDVTQTVELEAVPSNLNKSHYWIFRCPMSGRRCKKLHLIHGLFQHRTALRGVFYRQQVRTPCFYSRYMDAYDGICDLLNTADAPFFREYYAGKPTRRAIRMWQKIEKLKPRVSNIELKNLLTYNMK